MRAIGRSAAARYGVAVLISIAAGWGRVVAMPHVGDKMPFIFFFPAVMAAAWIGGIGPGLLTTASGTAFSAVYLMSPFRSAAVASSADRIGLATFCLIGIVISSSFERARRSHHVIHDTSQRLLSIGDALPALVSLFGTDRRYQFVNAQYTTWFGKPRDEIIGRPLPEVLGREAYARIEPYVTRALSGETVTYEERLPYASGGERDVQATYTPHRSEGKVVGVVALIVDVTERVQFAKERETLLEREREARKEEAVARDRLSTLAEASKQFSAAQLELQTVLRTVCSEVAHRIKDSCTINLIDPSGARLELAETCHLDPEAEAATRTVLAAAPIPMAETSTGRVAVTGEPLLVPVVPLAAVLASISRPYRDHLERFPLSSLVVVPLRIGERIIGTVAAGRGPGSPPYTRDDQSLLQELADRAALAIEHARLAEQLRALTLQAQQAVRVRDEFLSVAGHELKTPLAALQLQVEGLQRQAAKGAFGDEPRRLVERLGKAESHVERLENLIGGLLDVSTITAGKLALRIEEVELSALIADVVDRFSDHLTRASCRLTLDANDRVVGNWDRGRLDQVFSNLVANAIKYGAGKPVEIAIARGAGRARVAIHDHGIGIAPEDASRVFGRFERAVSDKHYGGLGLGLWISKQLVESMGGRIQLESELGVGSTFTVDLPLPPTEAAA